MKSLLTLILSLTAFFSLSAQQQLEWFTNVGSNGPEQGTGIVLDHDDNVINCGFFSNTLDLDAGPSVTEFTSTGGTDGYVSKTDRYGQFQWGVQIGGVTNDVCRDIDVDSLGNVYVIGVFADTLYIGDTLLVTAGVEDAFLAKLSPDGDLMWAQSFGGVGVDDVQCLDVHPVHGIHLSGGFRFTVDFDNGPGVTELTFIQNIDVFVLKLDLDGIFQWVVPVAGTSAETGEGVGVFDDGSVVSTGNFRTVVDFDPGEGVAELTGYGNDFYMQKLDVNGDFLWVKQIGGSSEDLIRDLALDDDGNILMAGEFKNFCDFDPGPDQYIVNSNGVTDIFMCKYDQDGNVIWADNIGGVANDAAYGIEADANGRFYATGFFSGTADIIPGPGEEVVSPGGNSRDMLVFAFEPDGTHIETMRMVSNSDVYGQAVAADSQGQIYVTGRYLGPTDFDPSEGVFISDNVGSNTDSYVLKLSECPTSVSYPVISACESFEFDELILTTTGEYASEYQTVEGCDSLIFLDLTILEPTAAEVAVSSCDSISLNGETFYQPGTYTQILTNLAGCDSILTVQFALDTDSTYEEVLACREYIFLGDTLTVSGLYVDSLTNVAGCDSLHYLDLTLSDDSLYFYDVLACGEYAYGDSIYTVPTDIVDTLVAASGCDSIVTLYLQFQTLDLTITAEDPFLTATAMADSWQWVDCSEILKHRTILNSP